MSKTETARRARRMGTLVPHNNMMVSESAAPTSRPADSGNAWPHGKFPVVTSQSGNILDLGKLRRVKLATDETYSRGTFIVTKWQLRRNVRQPDNVAWAYRDDTYEIFWTFKAGTEVLEYFAADLHWYYVSSKPAPLEFYKLIHEGEWHLLGPGSGTLPIS